MREHHNLILAALPVSVLYSPLRRGRQCGTRNGIAVIVYLNLHEARVRVSSERL